MFQRMTGIWVESIIRVRDQSVHRMLNNLVGGENEYVSWKAETTGGTVLSINLRLRYLRALLTVYIHCTMFGR